MKLLRVLFALIILVIVVLIIAITAVVLSADPNKLKPYIVQQIEKNSPYKASIQGKLHWSFYPKLGVQLDDLQLKDAQNAAIDFKAIQISASPALLLKRNLQASVYIERLRAMNLTIDNISSKVIAANDSVNLPNIKFNLYDGRFGGKLLLNHVSQSPAWDFNGNLSHVNLRNLIKDLDNKEHKLTVAGFVNGDVKLETVGKTKPQIIQNLSGTINASITDGALIGLDINYWLQTADGYFNKDQKSSPVDHGTTAFNQLGGLLVIKKGVAQTDNLQLNAKEFSTTSKGSINLNNKAINFQFNLQSSAGAKRQWTMPVTIDGSLDDYAVHLDLKDVGKSIMENQLNDPNSKASKMLDKILPQNAQDAFRKMINQ